MSNGSDTSYTLAQYHRIARIAAYQYLLETPVKLSVKLGLRYTDTTTFCNTRSGYVTVDP